LAIAGVVAPAEIHAQTIQPIAPLFFTKTVNSTSNPLPQVLTVASTVATSSLGFSISVVNGSGGSWLTTSPTGGTYYTPRVVTVSANPDVSLAAGTYNAQIIVKTGSTSITVPVSLAVKPAGAFFDELPGALTYSLQTAGSAPPAEVVPIRKTGGGTLTFTASASTAIGSGWITLSATTGTAPFQLSVAINPAKLPSQGKVDGTFTGQVLLKTAADSVTIPVSVTVSDTALSQINPLSFTKTVSSTSDALSQVVTVTNFDPGTTAVGFSVTTVNGSGANWLSTGINGGTYYAPRVLTISANPDVTTAAGTYTGEVILSSGSQAVVIPVSLSVEPGTASYFDELPGGLTFSMQTSGSAPPAEIVQIRNAGTGSLNFTASASTADGGNWLTLSAASGAAPYQLSVSISPANLPEEGKVDGTFTGQVVLKTGADTVTIPVAVTLADAVLLQINPLSFTKTTNSTSQPLSQVITVANTDPANQSLGFSVTVINGTGGNWLTTSINGGTYYAPRTITVSANPDVSLARGTYTAEILLSSGSQSVLVPVTLIVADANTAHFDELQGELTFSFSTSSSGPPPQLVQIRNAGSGSLSFTAAATTADGGKWLTLSATHGAAPFLLNVGITPANLPGQGKIAGTFTGQVLLKSGTDTATVPVSVTVDDAVLLQINPISFTKTVNSTTNPLPQVISVANTDPSATAIGFSISTVPGTGGSWLTASINGGTYYAPQAVTLSVAPNVSLAAGTYTAEVIISSGTQPVVVPVTLTIEPAGVPYFDTLPGALTFSSTATGAAMPSQSLFIRNAGPGTLDWSSTAITSDGGHWLSLASAAGTAPDMQTVSIKPANLPGKGRVAGTFTGQIMLQSTSGIVTVPITVTIGDSVFTPPSEIDFSKKYQAANPPTQSVNIASTGDVIGFSISTVTSTGGNWLSASINGGTYYTPHTVILTAKPDVNLAPGVYAAEVIVKGNGEPLVFPVSLTVQSASATATPTFNPPAGKYSSPQSVTISSATRDAAIHYTTDRSTPTVASPIYDGPVNVAMTETLKAIAIAPGFPQSAVASATYTLGSIAATPSVTQTITITEATSGVTVYYTTDGSTPTASSTKYTGPITLTTGSVLKFIAIGPNYINSAVRTVTTTIQ
jgi:hypothetical protein